MHIILQYYFHYYPYKE